MNHLTGKLHFAVKEEKEKVLKIKLKCLVTLCYSIFVYLSDTQQARES